MKALLSHVVISQGKGEVYYTGKFLVLCPAYAVFKERHRKHGIYTQVNEAGNLFWGVKTTNYSRVS